MLTPEKPTLARVLSVIADYLATLLPPEPVPSPAVGDPIESQETPTTTTSGFTPTTTTDPLCNPCLGNLGKAIIYCDGAVLKKVPCTPSSTLKTDMAGMPAFVP